MGYTHYWSVPTVPYTHDLNTWMKFVKDCKILYRNMPEHTDTAGGCCKDEPLFIDGDLITKYPSFNKNEIRFNGTHTLSKVKITKEIRQLLKKKGMNSTGIKWLNKDTLKIIQGLYDITKSMGEFESMAHFSLYSELSHETFYIERKVTEDSWLFCKTARKPYDLMVCAVLILYKYYFPEITVDSDGEFNDEWIPAFNFVADVLGKKKTIPLLLQNAA